MTPATRTAAGWRSPAASATLANLPRARETMAALGVDGLLTTCPEDVTYLTGYVHWPLYAFREHGAFALLTADGARALVAPLGTCEYLAQCPPDDCAVYTHGAFHLGASDELPLSPVEQRVLDVRARAPHAARGLDALALALRDLGLEGASVAVDDRALDAASAAACRALVAHPSGVEAGAVLRAIRERKTDAEVALLRYAALGVEAAMLSAFAGAAPGDRETDLERAFRVDAIERGIAPGHCELSFGGRAGGCFPPLAESTLARGQIVRADCGGRFDGYWADTGRNAACGEAPAALRAAHEALREGMRAMLGIVRAGVSVAELARLGIETVRASGLPGYQRHHVGHGIGLEMYERPLLTEHASAEETLCDGMVVNLELPYYELGLGGLQIEDTVVVRADGFELLTSAPHEIVACGGGR